MEDDPLGQRLKDARERRGLSLRQIATTTKISTVALEALESGDFSRLPGGIYSRAFIRAYAKEVGLDPEEAVRDFVGELTVHERDAARIRIRPAVSAEDRAFLERQQRAVRVFRFVAVVAAAGLIALLGWLAVTYWPVGAEVAGEGPSGEAPVTRQQALPPPPADPIPAREDLGAFSPAERERLTIAFEVTGACWVQVTADGLVVLSRLMQAGERETVMADRDLLIDVGNAGAFTWTINGRPAQALGLEGRHRQITVTRENAQSFLR
jgi:cytoskeletal protein RodZ